MSSTTIAPSREIHPMLIRGISLGLTLYGCVLLGFMMVYLKEEWTTDYYRQHSHSEVDDGSLVGYFNVGVAMAQCIAIFNGVFIVLFFANHKQRQDTYFRAYILALWLEGLSVGAAGILAFINTIMVCTDMGCLSFATPLYVFTELIICILVGFSTIYCVLCWADVLTFCYWCCIRCDIPDEYL